MRHLLTAISAAILLSVVFIMFANRDGNSIDGLSTDMSDSITEAKSRYYGDTLFQYDGKTVIADYFTEEDKEVSSLSTCLLLTYADTVAVDTCRVIGNGAYVADGTIFKYAVGIDTIRYDMRHLPDSVSPTREILSANIVEHKYVHSFELTDSSWRCDFKFLAYLPENHPTWLNQFIATIMRNDIQALYLDNKGADRLLKEYYGIKAKPKRVDGINAANMTPKAIARHFATVHEQLYRNEFKAEDVDGHGPKYDYMLEISPAWKSLDGRYVTYRFYSYYYTMGAHGFMEEYYLTFDNENGRILGYNDIFEANDFKKVLDLLEQEITAHKKEFMNFDGIYPASLEKDELESNASEILKEVYDGSYYPRPAMTRQGIVFSYQPYEKGSFAEGILHFVIPYSKLDIKIAL